MRKVGEAILDHGYRGLLRCSQGVSKLTGRHHGGCLYSLMLVGIPLVLIVVVPKQRLADWMRVSAWMLGILHIVFSGVVSSPQFWRGIQHSKTRSWSSLLFVQIWFLSLIWIWGIAVWSLVRGR